MKLLIAFSVVMLCAAGCATSSNTARDQEWQAHQQHLQQQAAIQRAIDDKRVSDMYTQHSYLHPVDVSSGTKTGQ